VHANVDALVDRRLPALLRDVHRVTVDPPELGDMIDLDEGGGVLFTAPAPNRVEPVVGEIGPLSPEGQFETTRVTVRLAHSRPLRRSKPQPPVFRAVQVRETLPVPRHLQRFFDDEVDGDEVESSVGVSYLFSQLDLLEAAARYRAIEQADTFDPHTTHAAHNRQQPAGGAGTGRGGGGAGAAQPAGRGGGRGRGGGGGGGGGTLLAYQFEHVARSTALHCSDASSMPLHARQQRAERAFRECVCHEKYGLLARNGRVFFAGLCPAPR